MIEKFTPEEIEILRKELKDYNPKSYKPDVCADGIKLIDEAFPFNEYDAMNLYARKELVDALYCICDHVTANYSRNTRGVHGKTQYRLKRHSYVQESKREKYKEVFDKIVAVILENKMPPDFTKKEDS